MKHSQRDRRPIAQEHHPANQAGGPSPAAGTRRIRTRSHGIAGRAERNPLGACGDRSCGSLHIRSPAVIVTARGIRRPPAFLVQRGAMSVADYRCHVAVLLDLECTLRMWSAVAINVLSGTDTAFEPWCYRLGDPNS